MKRIVLVSNRLPITAEKKKGQIHYTTSVGGLATGLDSFHQSNKCLWIGWPGLKGDRIMAPEKEKIRTHLYQHNCIPVFLTRSDIEKFYDGFSNKTIWPLFHYFPQHTFYETDLWKSYVHVNELFADAVLEHARDDDVIWVHDYQLMLLPALLREKLPNATIGFFLHIPFPSLEIFRLLPWRNELLTGLLGADLIGFHTYDYIRHFLNSVRRLLGHEYTFSQISYGSRLVKADVFPMGIDYKRFSSVGSDPEVKKEITSIREKTGDRALIIAIDRLDYTKGILQRLSAFDLFLDRNPDMKEKVTMILVEVPSRTAVESYRQLKRDIDESIGRINGKHGSLGWAPVLNLYRTLPFSTLCALYQTCDVALVTPLRDGMNLVAKEYVATKKENSGVLILSEMAGAAREMGEAIVVNPNNIDEIAAAIKEALCMEKEEQVNRIALMQQRLTRYDVRRWAHDFVSRLEQTRHLREKLQSHRLSKKMRDKLISEAANSSKALLMLDYDGTLVPHSSKPHKSIPGEKLLQLLNRLTDFSGYDVAIVSGRNKETLERWFGKTNVILCAEHGVWIKKPSDKWEILEPQENNWKKELKPLLELFTDRTPGSVLEEKDYSLAFHFRNTDPELAALRVSELKDAILDQVSNLNLGIIEGNKVIEIKNAGINKGTVGLKLLQLKDWDFTLAIGDDETDEYLFSVLPKETWSIKVGMNPTRARFGVESIKEVKELLEILSKIEQSCSSDSKKLTEV
ncbi:bifunctional alpha,alpha-trehalose-phosphate synthase (UDP-forming)/trehalose-phosphatase [Chitinispirillales bacterium ANBcel5]|uniref:bifunctional alpha,alpha-trehalose-phosphate synthase (UDP-forming)/trehalose-phosphatase n=1 Tax=Cellulosispirillum alkaliphilum TaxID=3039283 RepID=UPI002A4FEC84|nr:bifunctional alpha,alpha-trehalose-phosphate synthase (UDP-forming)/trehalose-phosphatase [Chitinispirillales bacterium ANBcel5]